MPRLLSIKSHIKTLEYLEILLQDWLFQHCHSQPWHIWDKHLDFILKQNIAQSHKQRDFADTFRNKFCKKQFDILSQSLLVSSQVKNIPRKPLPAYTMMNTCYRGLIGFFITQKKPGKFTNKFHLHTTPDGFCISPVEKTIPENHLSGEPIHKSHVLRI